MKRTKEEFIEKAIKIHGDKYDYSLVEYNGCSIKIKIKYDDIVYEQTPSCHLSGYCPEKKAIKMDRLLFIEKAIKIHGDKYDYSQVKYTDRFKKVKIIYNGKIYMQTPDVHLDGDCPEKIQLKKTTLDFIKKSKSIYGDKYDYSQTVYVNKLTKVKIIYSGMTYEQLPRYHYKTPPELTKISKGELKIQKFLDKNKINYIKQHTFLNCKYKKKLRFDFFIPTLNMCIEFDGIQHFKSIDYFGGKKSYDKICKNDKIKKEYCTSNNISLFRIKYTDFYNINNILTEKIINCQQKL